MTSQSRGFTTNRMRTSSTMAVAIQIACLPLRTDQEKMDPGSAEWMEA